MVQPLPSSRKALLTHISDVFEVVQSGHATAGLVPFENSTNGSVVFTLDDLADRQRLHPDITIHGEVYVDVHHCLVGHFAHNSSSLVPEAPDEGGSGTCTPTASDPRPTRPRSKPLGSLKHVQRLYSHPQAFGQCTAFISTYLKGVEVFEVSSTSKAAEVVSKDETGTWAAISSLLASDLYGLDLLGKSIEDRSDNTTRFLIIGRCPEPPADWNLIPPPSGYKGNKSMLSFTVPHDSPGGLAEALSCFKKFDLNLTSINSRPSLVKPFQYIFFVEFEGHRYEDPEGRVKGALEAIHKAAESWRWLGSWKRYR